MTPPTLPAPPAAPALPAAPAPPPIPAPPSTEQAGSWLVGSSRRRRILFWVLHVLLVLCLLVILAVINSRYRLPDHLFSSWPLLHAVWLPLLFVLVYLGGWMVWGLFRATVDRPAGVGDELLAAWVGVKAALEKANISLQRTPLFLVLGKPKAGLDAVFASAGVAFAVRERRPPLAVYANGEAIYLALDDVGVVGRLCSAVAAEAAPRLPQLVELEDELLTPAVEVEGSDDEVIALLPLPGLPVAHGLTAEAVTAATRQLDQFARLLARSRRPWCPVNGLLWLLPYSVTARPDHLSAAVRADLGVLEAALQVDCPMSAVVADGQEIPGFRELLADLPGGTAGERLFGRSFPLVPNVAPADRLPMVEAGLRWFAGSLVPALVNTRLAELPDPARAAVLWRLTDELANGRQRIAHVVAAGLLSRPDRPPMLNGVYFAATGTEAADRGFVPAVLKELLQRQNLCAWTEAGVRQERDTGVVVRVGYAAIVVLVAAVALFTWWCLSR